MSSVLTIAAEEIRSAAGEARRRTPFNIAVLCVSVAVLAFGPLVLTLLRAEDYPSSTTISLATSTPGPELRLPNAAQLLSGPLTVSDLQKKVIRHTPWLTRPGDLPKHVTVRESREGGQPVLVVTARGPTAHDARELAKAVATPLIAAGESKGKFLQGFQLDRIRRVLRNDGLSAARRRALLQRRDAFARAMRRSEPIFDSRPTRPTLASERLGDRVLGALPGTLPARPNPLWAGVAGLALAFAFGVWVLVFGFGRPTGGRGSTG